MTKTSSKPGPRLGTLMRGGMAEAYDARGHTASDLHLHYSQKQQRDVVLVGQLSYFHFLLIERDPNVRTADYTPTERLANLVGDELASLVTASVTTVDGREIWRRVIRQEPDTAKSVDELRQSIGLGRLSGVSQLEVLTFQELVADQTWTRNTHRALAWIAAARDWPLVGHKQTVLGELQSRREATFAHCLALGAATERALLGAAALQLALNGNVTTNLGIEPLSADTLFAAARQGA